MPWTSPRTGRRAASLLLGLVAVAGCRGGEAAGRMKRAVPEVPVLRDGLVELPAGYAERAGIAIAPARYEDVTPIVHVTGVLEFDALRLAAVGSRIAGRVAEVEVIEGSKVEVGQVLGTIVSAELGTAQADIAAMEARVLTAQRDVARKRSLLAEGITSQRELDLAISAAAIAEAQLRAARQRVTALAGSRGSKQLGVAALRSPIAGDVVGVQVSRGQAVVPSHTAFMIADPRTLWVRLAVFEGELLHVQVGDPVELSPTTGSEETFAGVVEFVAVALDPMTRSAEVRVVVDNHSGKLRAGQTVQANIRPASVQRRAVVVPRQAVLQIDGAPTVFVAQTERSFESRSVTLGVGDFERVEIQQGLAADEQVVVSGVFALKGELYR
ncbi:efflux RND transporter periplasmic adaptor subunit [Nannocystis sp. SCPEA4]|uniref:efflux RND transporter periplasmic adaptor subunit n=1 Tax=Nannocystis sp. SCPEA4 TaxID=2996787 RepID=UPI0022719E09|nr:efflux RND transporter periplasmic adaptor subunit [Nannocystis sp. SCPEA4]MCY1053945.1 efflux RND transporter periplasmic adaptor subunit [Nannocystis sp. SCPEA4]